MKKQLSGSQKAKDLLMELDEAVGGYSATYGEAAYALGFHDGLDMGLEHKKRKNSVQGTKLSSPLSMEDMTHLIYIYDAYKSLNKFLLGHEMPLSFNEGIIGKMDGYIKLLVIIFREVRKRGNFQRRKRF